MTSHHPSNTLPPTIPPSRFITTSTDQPQERLPIKRSSISHNQDVSDQGYSKFRERHSHGTPEIPYYLAPHISYNNLIDSITENEFIEKDTLSHLPKLLDDDESLIFTCQAYVANRRHEIERHCHEEFANQIRQHMNYFLSRFVSEKTLLPSYYDVYLQHRLSLENEIRSSLYKELSSMNVSKKKRDSSTATGKSQRESPEKTTSTGSINRMKLSTRQSKSRKKPESKKAKLDDSQLIKKPPKRKEKQEHLIEADRDRIWSLITKKHVIKAARSFNQLNNICLSNNKRIAQLTYREVNRANSKIISRRDFPTRSKKMMREMLAYWKKNEKEEKELRKKAEKIELERRRAEEEARESRRQARKLNFLINQTELYSHFIAKKITPQIKQKKSIQESFSSMTTEELIDQEDESAHELLQERAQQQAMLAVSKQVQRTKAFDMSHHTTNKMIDDSVVLDQMDFQHPTGMPESDNIDSILLDQPSILKCSLKAYQRKGLHWLVNLYEQGINGILADEMGLGKTVQSIALMAHLAERQNIWGPFLVVAPASTLHNWQQEVTKFVPSFKVLPYWGSIGDRKVLRKFWNQTKLSMKDAPFHVLITSYQLVVTDEKYFQRIKWQYMVLDEAQAIKSSSSIRWKTLLGFQCRNRLLLTGTPIQNSMQELWALLHFIMPTLFDSHAEFSEWFSKDIESHAENKSLLNAHQLSRLHMILKPFMLRRIKKDVEHELGDKIELDISCGLSARQNRLYSIVRRKISTEEILEKLAVVDGTSSSSSFDHLMNLVMQFRKICNHPELLEHTDVLSPFYFTLEDPLPLESSQDRDGIETYTWTRPCHSPIVISLPRLMSELFESKKSIDCDISIHEWNRVEMLSKMDHEQQLINLDIYDTNNFLIRFPRIFLYKALANPPKVTLNHPYLNQNIHIKAISTRCYSLLEKGMSLHYIHIPKQLDLAMDSGKMFALDKLLSRLKEEGHRVLIYFQMTRMMDLMEDYLHLKHYRYLRLDGSSKISDRRDMVSDWQTKPDIFVFLLSTRAGGLGINLTAADTVIFYDSDWNPTVDQQAMDRAHRLGQTKQVTVYRLITQGTIEERIQQRAQQKHEIQKVVIAGGEFKQMDVIKPKEIVSLLLDENGAAD